MCDLKRKYKGKEFIGWKVVAVNKKNDNYFSPAMGCKYPIKGKVPIIRKQHTIGSYYRPDILEHYYLKKKDMVGRTAVFKYKKDAINFYTNFSNTEHYTFEVKKVKITEDLMLGIYRDTTVIAGKHMEFLD